MQKPISKSNLEKLVEEVIDFLTKRELFYDVFIYAGGKRYASPDNINKNDGTKTMKTKNGSEYMLYEDKEYKGSEYVEYANDETLTMTFEGAFHQEYNGNYGNFRIYDEFNKIPEKYGLYFEQGYSWSLATYPV